MPVAADDSASSYVIAAPEHDAEEEVAEFSPVNIAEATTAFKRLSVSEAVIELDMTGAPVVVFRHAGNGLVNMVYRRTDGNVESHGPTRTAPRHSPRSAAPASGDTRTATGSTG